MARLREGRLNLHDTIAHAFLATPELDTLMARLTSAGPTRTADLVTGSAGHRRKLVRTLLWLRKFDLVEFGAPES